MKRKVLLLLLTVFMLSFSSNSNAQVSLIGIGATGDWTIDHDMVDSGGGIWTLVDYVMPGGAFKFRLDHAWTTAWGNNGGTGTFPIGVGTTGDGLPDIIAIPGTWSITFNQNTGEYTFAGAPIPTVKLEGTAVTTPGGVVFSTLDAENYTATNVTLVAGTGQFSIDGSLSGSTDFPGGAATDPALFIPIPAGVYSTITFNTSDGTFLFTAAPLIPSVAIVGSATPYGWPTNAPGEVDAGVLTSTDGITYTGTVMLTVTADPEDNKLKFRQENSWTNQWGGVTFPAGPDPTHPTDDIIVTASGLYQVTLNRLTGAYAFSFATIALVGDGAGGWPVDPQIDANVLTTTDGVIYTKLGMMLTTGEVKFRQNNAWALAWGGTTFPSGTADTAGGSPNIPATAGTYDVSLNTTTLAYNFAPLATKGFSTSNFKVYPNPTANNWNFSSVKENIQSIQIVDVLGKTVMTVNPNNTAANVDASALNAGIYFAKITTATANQTMKLLKN